MLQADSNITDEIGTRAFMTFAPQGTTIPFVVFRASILDDVFSKDKTSTWHKYLVELDIYHNSIAEAEALGGKIYNYFQGYQGTTSGGEAVKGTKLERADQETDEDGWKIWSQDYELILET